MYWVEQDVETVQFWLIVIREDGVGECIFVEYWAYLLCVDAVEPRGKAVGEGACNNFGLVVFKGVTLEGLVVVFVWFWL